MMMDTDLTHIKNSQIDHLRHQVQRIERAHTAQNQPWILSTGHSKIDHDLPEGGLPSHAIHAFTGAKALSFLLKIISGFLTGDFEKYTKEQNINNKMKNQTDLFCIWCRSAQAQNVPYGPALSQFKIDTNQVVFVQTKNDQDLLWATEESLKSQQVFLIVVEPESEINLTTSRRLQLAAETGGSIGILLSTEKKHLSPANALFSRWVIDPQILTAQNIDSSRIYTDNIQTAYSIKLERMRNASPQEWLIQS